MVADASTTASLSPFSTTVSLSRGTTATTENSAPAGFQHLVQPHAWLCADWVSIRTFTGWLAHLQTSVPPVNVPAPGTIP